MKLFLFKFIANNKHKNDVHIVINTNNNLKLNDSGFIDHNNNANVSFFLFFFDQCPNYKPRSFNICLFLSLV
jgi:hypothetical protein